MLKTEQQIQAFCIPPDGRAVCAILFAAVPLAFRTGGLALGSRLPAGLFKSNEYFRIKRHDIYMEVERHLGKNWMNGRFDFPD